ncbi:hypothetical protein LXA43DRAFT_20846 [Ganoderma leucocontextum]|nr:hypothetical protein LXA43DRAFT_20846 [Ganoderma leucocontextum]
MSDISLTPNVCARLGDSTDYRVLVSRPVVKVTEIEELVERDIGGFVALYRAILKDGDEIAFKVVFPRDADIGPPVEGNPIPEGALIKIDQMVRIPNGSESIIVVYSADIVTEGFELKLTDMDQELRRLTAMLRSETELRQQVEARLRALLPANLEGLSPQTLVDQMFEAFIQIFEVTTQTIV